MYPNKMVSPSDPVKRMWREILSGVKAAGFSNTDRLQTNGSARRTHYGPNDVVLDVVEPHPLTKDERRVQAHRRSADSQTRFLVWQQTKAAYNDARNALPPNALGAKAHLDDPRLTSFERVVLKDFSRR